MDLSTEDCEIVATAKRDGVAVAHNLLTAVELTQARRDFDTAHLDAGKGRYLTTSDGLHSLYC